MKELLDLDIVKRVQKGDKSEFTKIVRKYDKPLLRFIARYVRDEELARDILQETFIKIYLNIHNFEFRCSFKNWIYKIAINTARNKIRAMKEMESLDDVVIIELCNIETDMMSEEQIEQLKKCVQRLPEKQKKALELRVFQDLSFKEVSVLMDCPYDTAKANYRHAMLRLKDYLRDIA